MSYRIIIFSQQLIYNSIKFGYIQKNKIFINSFFIIPIIIYNKQQMFGTLKPNQLTQYEHLDKQYPGILQMSIKLQPSLLKNLSQLCQLIKYNIPKAYYSQQISELDQKIQEIYFDYVQRRLDDSGENRLLPAENQRKLSNFSDQEQAEANLQTNIQLVRLKQKASIQQISNFIKNFDVKVDIQFVNLRLITQVNSFRQIRHQNAVYQNFQVKQKQKQTYNAKKRKNSYKNKDQSGNKQKQKYKSQIIITMGDKIPLQVKQIRNYIKKVSLQSFAVNSIKMQQQKSQTEKQKLLISLSLNKVAKQNIQFIFEDIQKLIKQKQELASFMIDQILKKCINQFKMAEVYIDFACMITKIPNSHFGWQWNGKQNETNNINHYHRLFVQKLQNVFESCVSDLQTSKNIKYLSYVIGRLIQKRKLSRKVYFDVTNILIRRIIEQQSRNQRQKQVQQNLMQALIYLIQSLRSLYQQIWVQYKLKNILTIHNFQFIKNVNGNQPKTMEEVLTILAQRANFETLRIKCLIQNLFDRKQKILPFVQTPSQQSQSSEQVHQLNQTKIKQLLNEQDGLNTLAHLYNSNKDYNLLFKIIILLLDGKQSDVMLSINKFKQLFEISKEQFTKFWQNSYVNFAYLQCDLPSMTKALTVLLTYYLGQTAYKLIIQNLSQNQNQDEEDILFFVKKIQKKIVQFSKTNGI